jgi:membrane protease YdiL (CAAX protease family)
VPLLVCLVAYCRSRGLSLLETFGLRLERPAVGVFVRATIALVGVAMLADLAIEIGGARLGAAPHWTDGFQEALVWGTRAEVLADLLDSVALAPIVEEILFRGVLYATLRLALGPWLAAGLSAALFATAHGYGVVGFASVLASGVLWAIAYERTGSLLPGIAGHALGNLLATAIVLLLLRL